MARKSGFVRRNGVMRREMIWLDNTVSQTTLPAASNVVLVATLNAAALLLRPFTIVRTRGVIAAKSDQQGANEDFQVGYGQIVTTDVAAGVGITAIPTPESEAASDWLVYEWIMGSFGFVSGIGIFNPIMERVIDSKAMRKVDIGDDLCTVVEASAISLGVVITEFTRTLIKLH